MLTAAETIGSYRRRQHRPSLQFVRSATTAYPIALAQQFSSHFERAGRQALDALVLAASASVIVPAAAAPQGINGSGNVPLRQSILVHEICDGEVRYDE